MRLRHIGIIILSFLSIFGIYDVIGVDVWIAVIVGYIFTYLLVSVLLFILSYRSKEKDIGWLRNLDIVGICVSTISVTVTILYFIWDIYII